MPTIFQRLQHIIGDSFGAAIVEQTLEKAIREAKERATAPETQFFDPLTMFMGKEFVTKRHQPLNFHDLRKMASNPIIASIVQTRINQVASFTKPSDSHFEPGFVIRAKDEREGQTLKSSTEAVDIETWIAANS